MSNKQNANFAKRDRVESPQTATLERSPSGSPAWWLVFVRELNELWMGGKAPLLLILYCVVLGSLSYLQATIDQQDPVPPKEMLFFVLGCAIAFGELIGLVIAADSLSGERERSTLEGLLLTPTSRKQLVVGKFLAAISPWPVALVITIPYLAVLAQGDEMLGPAVFWGTLLGSLLALSFAGLGMLVSFWSNANKTSLAVSMTLYIILFIPTQLPSGAQKGAMGYLLKRVNPMESVNQFLENVLVNNRTPQHMGPWLRSPIVFGILVFGLLFLYASPGLRLEAGTTNRWWTHLRRGIGLAVIACFIMISLSPS